MLAIKAMSELYDSMNKPGTKIVVLPYHEQGEMKGKANLIRIAVYDEKGNTLNFCDISDYHHNHGNYMSFLVRSEGTVYSYDSDQDMYPKLKNIIYGILNKIGKQEIEYNKKYDSQEFFAIVPALEELLLNHHSTTSTPAKPSTHLPEKALSDADVNKNDSTTSTPASKMTNKEAEEIWKTAKEMQENDPYLGEIKEYNRQHNIGYAANATDYSTPFSVNSTGIWKPTPPTPAIAGKTAATWTIFGAIAGIGGVVGIAVYSWWKNRSNDGRQYIVVQRDEQPDTQLDTPSTSAAERGEGRN